MTETARFYPKSPRYFAQLTPDRPLFQGDIFRGGFGAFWRHPEALRAALAGEPPTTPPPFPDITTLRHSTWLRGTGHAMVLPQPCEFSEDEKGATHPFRLVAPILPGDKNADVDLALVRKGQVGHTIWVPRWTNHGPQDHYVDLRFTTSIDALFLTRDSRVAALSRPAWIATVDHLSRYFTGLPINTVTFAVNQGHLHPDA